jgi:hypothetical protein
MSNTALRPASKRVDDFLAEFDPVKPRIIFGVDATASRQPTWDSAAMLQAQMFHAAGNISAQLVYFRCWNGETRASQWFDNSAALADAMSKITCVAGHTQFEKVLKHAAREHAAKPIAALILISDSCEEEESALYAAARKLPVPVFMFQEGRNELVASIYARIAEVTGGALAQFDSSSAAKLSELLRAVAVFAQGGVKALEAQGGAAARLLLAQIRK